MASFNRRQLLLLLLYVRRRRRSKQFWIHPLIRERYITGAFYVLHDKLRQYEHKFYNYYRMSTTTFDYILYHIKGAITLQNTNYRACIPPTEMLAVTLRYLASGNTFTDMSYSYQLGIKTISRIVTQVCHQIWTILSGEHLTAPTSERWLLIAEGFKQRANFPNCIGCVDGKHIRIEKFPKSGTMNFNYKGYFSIVLLAVVDSDYRFVYVDIGSYGKDCDSGIFHRTNFYQLLTEGKLNIPPPVPLHSTLNNRMPHVLVGDEAFQLTQHLLRPFGGNHLDVKKRVYNYRHCRARRYVECAFGIMANKWRIFHRPLNVKKELSKTIVKACVVLHNIVRERDGYRSDDMFMSIVHDGLTCVPRAGSVPHGGRTANDIRNNFADYFVSSEGSLPWQMNKI